MQLPQVAVEQQRVEDDLAARLEQLAQLRDAALERPAVGLAAAGELGHVARVRRRGDDRRVGRRRRHAGEDHRRAAGVARVAPVEVAAPVGQLDDAGREARVRRVGALRRRARRRQPPPALGRGERERARAAAAQVLGRQRADVGAGAEVEDPVARPCARARARPRPSAPARRTAPSRPRARGRRAARRSLPSAGDSTAIVSAAGSGQQARLGAQRAARARRAPPRAPACGRRRRRRAGSRRTSAARRPGGPRVARRPRRARTAASRARSRPSVAGGPLTTHRRGVLTSAIADGGAGGELRVDARR